MTKESQSNSGHNSTKAAQALSDARIQGTLCLSVVGASIKLEDMPKIRKLLAKKHDDLYWFIKETRARELDCAILKALHEGRDFCLLDFARELDIHKILLFPKVGDYHNFDEDFFYGDHFAWAKANLWSHVGGDVFKDQKKFEGVRQGGDIEIRSIKI